MDKTLRNNTTLTLISEIFNGKQISDIETHPLICLTDDYLTLICLAGDLTIHELLDFRDASTISMKEPIVRGIQRRNPDAEFFTFCGIDYDGSGKIQDT